MNSIKLFQILFFAALLAACGSQESKTQTPEEIVAQRADAYWQALVAGDLETAYGYLSPATRELKNLERYKRGIFGVGKWQEASITKVECEEQRCLAWVKVRMRYFVRILSKMMETTDEFHQTWVYDQGTDNWWMVPKR